MFILGSQLDGLDIVSLQTGQTVGNLGSPVIDPAKLEILAFYVHSGWLGHKRSVLLAQDIRQLAQNALLIDSFEEIQDPDDIVRLKAVLDSGFKLDGILVVNESGIKLGKVEDFTLQTGNYKVQKLYIKQPLTRNLLNQNLIVDRGQIIDVTPQKITVRDASVKEPLAVPIPPPIPTD